LFYFLFFEHFANEKLGDLIFAGWLFWFGLNVSLRVLNSSSVFSIVRNLRISDDGRAARGLIYGVYDRRRRVVAYGSAVGEVATQIKAHKSTSANDRLK